MQELGVTLEEVMNLDGKDFNLWYNPPEHYILSDMYNCARDVWLTYDDTYGYASEKIAYLGHMKDNPRDWMLCWTMFDDNNQNKFASLLLPESKAYLKRAVMGE